MAEPANDVPIERSVDDVIAALDDEQTAILRQSYANVKSQDGRMKRVE